eukprot:5390543-Alexandrium_andersonii.AAC.1
MAGDAATRRRAPRASRTLPRRSAAPLGAHPGPPAGISARASYALRRLGSVTNFFQSCVFGVIRDPDSLSYSGINRQAAG